MAERIAYVRVVPGGEWIADGADGGPTQESQRYLLRRVFWNRAVADGWRVRGEPEEITEYDEERREVKLWIGATAERDGS